MSVTSGFFDSVNHDRKYSVASFSSMFDGLIGDGVFASIGSKFTVLAAGGMNVTVGTGRAWFDHTWTYNNAPLTFTISPSDAAKDRVDTIVLEVDRSKGVRSNSIKVVKGVPNDYYTRPDLIKTEYVKQFPLADVVVHARGTKIVQWDITNRVGTRDCPFVIGVVKTIETDELIRQWSSKFETMYEDMQNRMDQAASAVVPDGAVTLPKLAAETKDYIGPRIVQEYNRVTTMGETIYEGRKWSGKGYFDSYEFWGWCDVSVGPQFSGIDVTIKAYELGEMSIYPDVPFRNVDPGDIIMDAILDTTRKTITKSGRPWTLMVLDKESTEVYPFPHYAIVGFDTIPEGSKVRIKYYIRARAADNG